jgi:hypothetical protein
MLTKVEFKKAVKDLCERNVPMYPNRTTMWIHPRMARQIVPPHGSTGHKARFATGWARRIGFLGVRSRNKASSGRGWG